MVERRPNEIRGFAGKMLSSWKERAKQNDLKCAHNFDQFTVRSTVTSSHTKIEFSFASLSTQVMKLYLSIRFMLIASAVAESGSYNNKNLRQGSGAVHRELPSAHASPKAQGVGNNGNGPSENARQFGKFCCKGLDENDCGAWDTTTSPNYIKCNAQLDKFPNNDFSGCEWSNNECEDQNP